MTQLPLDLTPKLRSTAPATSVAAAERLMGRTGTKRREVYELIRDWPWAGPGPGMTDEEIAATLNMNPSTVRPRRLELVEAGLVRDSGRTRKTRSDREAIVWIAT